MATPIPFQQTSAANGIKAPDITKPGELFSNALKGLANTVKGIGEQRVTDATNVFQNELRTATKSGNFADVNLDGLTAVGANASELTSAESALRNSQLDVLGRETEAEFQQRFTDNAPAVQKAVEQLKQSDPELGKLVTVDNSGSLQFSSDLNIPNERIESAKDAIARSLQAPNSGFNALRNSREIAAVIRQRVRAIGGSAEDSERIIKSFKSYRKGFDELSEEEQVIVSNLTAEQDVVYQSRKADKAITKQKLENALGYTSAEATTLLQTKESAAFDFIRDSAAIEAWIGEGGSDANDHIRDLFTKGKTSSGVPIKPWMVVETLKQVTDPEEGWQTFLDDEFDERLETIARSDLKDKLEQASLLGLNYQKDLLVLEQQNLLAKNGIVKQVKTQAGIRNSAFNRSIAERTLQAELAQQAQPTVPPTPVSNSVPTPVPTPQVQAPDPVKARPPNPAALQSIPRSTPNAGSYTSGDVGLSNIGNPAVNIPTAPVQPSMSNRGVITRTPLNIAPEVQNDFIGKNGKIINEVYSTYGPGDDALQFILTMDRFARDPVAQQLLRIIWNEFRSRQGSH